MHRTRTLKGSAIVAGLLALVIATSALGVGAANPSVRFTSPMAGAKTTSTVKATVKLTSFKICATCVGKTNGMNQGHLHFSLDGGKFDYPKYSGANGKLAVKLGIAGKYSPAVLPTITYKNLPKGKHTLKAFLANNDHSANGAKATTTFWVK
jgi:hypothetical protein